jgi:hypothetical protein
LAASAVIVAASATALFAAPLTSYAAAAPNPNFRITPVDKSNPNVLTATLPDAFSVGDCVAFRGSSVTLQAPGFGNSVTFLTWHQRSSTSRTRHADVWHGTFRLLNSAGQTLITFTSLDGAQMTQIGAPYEWTVFSPVVAMSSFTYSAITEVQWEGRC